MATKNVFISYAHEDEVFKDKLEKHLSGLVRNNQIKIWTDRVIQAGQEWDDEIKTALQNADIILFLVSADFMASNYIHNVEIEHAMQSHNNGDVAVVPVIIRPCDFRSLPLKKLQALPKNSLAITKWPDEDEAFLDVVHGIKLLIADKQNSAAELDSSKDETNKTAPVETKQVAYDINEIRRLISMNKTEQAIQLCVKYFSGDASVYNELLVLSNRLQDLQKRQRMGFMEYDVFVRNMVQVNMSLLELLESIADK